jgi:hypothetical protein
MCAYQIAAEAQQERVCAARIARLCHHKLVAAVRRAERGVDGGDDVGHGANTLARCHVPVRVGPAARGQQ